MSSQRRFFLLVADRSAKEPWVQDLGPDSERAMTALLRAEREHAGADVDVVLLGADSLETLKRTHSSYWTSSGEFLERIVGNGRRPA